MDPISDMLIKIKNAQAVGKETVEIQFSNLKYEIAKILQAQGFIQKVEKEKKKPNKRGRSKEVIEIILKYNDKIPAISGVRKISKSGQRIYLPSSRIRKVKGGYGISVISTSKGLMTDKEARKNKIGGEVICEIW